MLRNAIIIWILLGFGLLGLNGWLVYLSQQFTYEGSALVEPVWRYTLVTLAAGVVYLLAIWRIATIDAKKTFKVVFQMMIVIGLGLRISFLFSNVVLEDDHYRYLWEGALLANDVNPYSVSPKQVLDDDLDILSPQQQQRVKTLAAESGEVIKRINHPQYRSVYPLTAQAAFALSYKLGPWDLTTWRVLLLGFDLLGVWALYALLSRLQKSPIWIGVFWLNPLMAKESINSAHIDGLMIPLVIWALVFAYDHRSILSSLLIGLAAGVKIWPILLLPFLWKHGGFKRRMMGPSLFVLLILGALMFWPIYVSGIGDDLGFNAYGKRWEMNDGIYMLFFKFAQFFSEDFLQKHAIARGIAVFILFAVMVYRLIMSNRSFDDLLLNSLICVATLFMVSPTQFPWYFLWVIPFLVLRPQMSLLILSVLLAIYYSRFHYESRAMVETFDEVIVWIQYVPVLILLALELKYHQYRNILKSRKPPENHNFPSPHY